MPWDRSTPSDPKYRSREHRAERKRLEQEMQRVGYLTCAQPVCVMPTRIIRPGEPWHVGHDDTGTAYIGPVQERCNVHDAAVRARARRDRPRRWEF
jgi:hypothetical protein